MAKRKKTGKKADTSEIIEDLELRLIDPDDTYCFRIGLNVDTLAEDIKKNGQDIPIIVRALGDGVDVRAQLICGFRRVAALKKIGNTTASAIFRELTDDEALRLSWAENEQRRSYTDLDRAHAVLKANRSGKTMKELKDVFGLGEKQLHRLKTLAEMPVAVKRAIADGTITTTHAVVLDESKHKYRDEFDYKTWIDAISEEEFSIRKLRRRINAAYRETAEPTRFFSEDDGVVRLRAVKLDPKKLGNDDKAALREMAQRLLALADS